MSNPHDKWNQAEALRYVLWCEGRLEELRREGLVEGQSALTEAGWVEYRSLVASGFVPTKEKVIWTLKRTPHIPPELAEQLAALVLDQGRSTNNPALIDAGEMKELAHLAGRSGAEVGEPISEDVTPGMGWPTGLTKRTCLESLESRYFTADIFLNPPNHYYPTDGPQSEVLITRKDSFKETFTVDSDQGELADLVSFAGALASLEHEGAMLPEWGHRVDSPNKDFSATVYPGEWDTQVVLEFHERTPGEARDEALHTFLFEAEDLHDLAARVAKRHAELRAELRADQVKRAGPEEWQEQIGQEATRTPPLYDLKLAGVRANVQRNETERGTTYDVSVFQPFSEHDGFEKVTSSIREQEIPAVVQLLLEAQRCIQAERKQAQDKEQQVQVTRNR
jgi:hypothetical protein